MRVLQVCDKPQANSKRLILFPPLCFAIESNELSTLTNDGPTQWNVLQSLSCKNPLDFAHCNCVGSHFTCNAFCFMYTRRFFLAHFARFHFTENVTRKSKNLFSYERFPIRPKTDERNFFTSICGFHSLIHAMHFSFFHFVQGDERRSKISVRFILRGSHVFQKLVFLQAHH